MDSNHLLRSYLNSILPFFIISILSFLISAKVCGFGKDYDVIFHYFVSNAAFSNPVLFLSQWNKPIYTIITAPFAYLFNYQGVVFISIFSTLLTTFLLYRTAQRLKAVWPWLLLLFPVVSRSVLPYGSLSLTEPLAGLFLTTIIYFLSREKLRTVIILCGISFLIRQEFIILIPFAIFIIIKTKRWQLIPWVFFGMAFFELLLAVFNPELLFNSFTGGYDTGESVYGSGTLGHFFYRFSIMTGGNLFTITVITTSVVVLMSFVNSLVKNKDELDITYFFITSFSAYTIFGLLLGHSLVWYLGVYASAGMERVLLPILQISCFLLIISLSRINGFVGKTIILLCLLATIHENFIDNFALTKHYYKSTYTEDEYLVVLSQESAIRKFVQEQERVIVNKPELAFYAGLNPKLGNTVIQTNRFLEPPIGAYLLVLPELSQQNWEPKNLFHLSNKNVMVWGDLD